MPTFWYTRISDWALQSTSEQQLINEDDKKDDKSDRDSLASFEGWVLSKA